MFNEGNPYGSHDEANKQYSEPKSSVVVEVNQTAAQEVTPPPVIAEAAPTAAEAGPAQVDQVRARGREAIGKVGGFFSRVRGLADNIKGRVQGFMGSLRSGAVSAAETAVGGVIMGAEGARNAAVSGVETAAGTAVMAADALGQKATAAGESINNAFRSAVEATMADWENTVNRHNARVDAVGIASQGLKQMIAQRMLRAAEITGIIQSEDAIENQRQASIAEANAIAEQQRAARVNLTRRIQVISAELERRQAARAGASAEVAA